MPDRHVWKTLFQRFVSGEGIGWIFTDHLRAAEQIGDVPLALFFL
jgi:hypothetical protein